MNAKNKDTTQAPKTRRTVILAMLIAAVATLGVCTLYTNHQYEVDMEYLSTVKIENQDSLLETIPTPEVSLPDRVNYPVYWETESRDLSLAGVSIGSFNSSTGLSASAKLS